jgi:hypothetical protein
VICNFFFFYFFPRFSNRCYTSCPKNYKKSTTDNICVGDSCELRTPYINKSCSVYEDFTTSQKCLFKKNYTGSTLQYTEICVKEENCDGNYEMVCLCRCVCV